MVPGVRSLKFAASRKCLRARRLDGKLIAGRSFNTAGGAPASRIANWDGSSWQVVWTDSDVTVNERLAFDVTPQATDNPAFQVRFNYQDANSAEWFSFDNVRISAFVNTACATGPAPAPAPAGGAGTVPLRGDRVDTAVPGCEPGPPGDGLHARRGSRHRDAGLAAARGPDGVPADGDLQAPTQPADRDRELTARDGIAPTAGGRREGGGAEEAGESRGTEAEGVSREKLPSGGDLVVFENGVHSFSNQ